MIRAKRGDLVLVDREYLGNRVPAASRYILATAVKFDGSGKVSWARTAEGSFPAGNVYTLRSFAARGDLAGQAFGSLEDARTYLETLLPEGMTP